MGGTVEQTLNALLDAEANRLYGASNEGCKDTRASRRAVPRRESRSGETEDEEAAQADCWDSVIKRYQRCESSVEAALIKMYLAAVSMRQIEDLTEALWDNQVSPGAVLKLNKKIND